MDQRVYLAYGGDEVELGTTEDFYNGLAKHTAFQALEDIIADMQSNHADTAEITITIR
jgi:hypothetical protein